MQLKNDFGKDAHRRAAKHLGMRIQDFEARLKLLREQGRYMKTLLADQELNSTVAEVAVASSVKELKSEGE